MRSLIPAVLVMGLFACRAVPRLVAPVHLFGPVIDNETIAGRANDSDDANPVRLLIAERDIVTIDLTRRTFVRHSLEMADSSSCWGLARLEDGTLWTICDWRRLRQIDESGATRREIGLDAAYVALFSASDRLLFQRAEFVAPDQALVAGTPGDPHRTPWSTLQTRAYKMARTSVAALNLVSCGNTRSRERACWFPDDPGVALIDHDGHTRRMDLAGIDAVPPEVLLTSENPARPVRDAYVDRTGSVWVISAGEPVRGAPEYPGGWLLAHYASGGAPLDRMRISEPARLILRADDRRVVLLLGSGYVAEVRL
jgi:hypothetical protein